MKTLETERLVLRTWEPGDADFVFDLNSRWEVRRFLGTTPSVMQERDEAVKLIERWSALEHPVHHIWAITRQDDDGLLGALLLKPIPASGTDGAPSGDTEIGWHLHPDAWGHGYASEAAARVLTYAFDKGLDRVVAVTNPENTASQAVCLRIGMTHLGRSDIYYDTVCELFEARRSLPAQEQPRG
ncbi:GNAT family N-acetyltransferase [Okibacterium endophyticum]